jgi:hypothetical protein
LTAANYTLTGFVTGQGALVPQSATANYVAPDAGTNIGITSGLVLSDFVANSGTNLSNYQLPSTGSGTGTITQAPLSAVIVGNPTKTYDSTTAASLTSANYQLTGFVGSQSAAVAQPSGIYASANAGTETVTATLASGDFTAGSATNLNNYALPVSASGTGTINRAPLVITGVSTTPQVYNGTTVDALSGAVLTGTVYGGDTPALTNTSTGTLGNSGNVGTDAVTTNMGLSGTGSSNYVLTQPTGLAAVISAAPLSATSSVNRTYTGTTVADLSGTHTTFTGFMAGQGATVNSGVTGTFTSPNVAPGIAVTRGALSASDLTANGVTLLSNYTLPASDNGTGTISAATLTYTAVPSSFVYGTTPSGLSGSVSGFVNGETLAGATTGTATFSTAATSSSSVGHYAIDGSGLLANNGNYVFSQAPPNATALAITPAPLTVVNVATTSRPYNGSNIDALTGATLTGTFYNGDAPVLTNATSGILGNGGNAGTDSVTTSMGLGGPGGGNYALIQPSGLTAVISRVALSATSTATKSYDGNNIADLSGTHTVLTGFIGAEGATVNSGVTGTFAGVNVGPGISITGGALTAGDLTVNGSTLLANYTLPSSDNGSGSITAAVVNLSGARVYDRTTDAAAGIFGPAGAVSGVNGENLVLTGSGTISLKDVGTRSLTSLGTLVLNDGTGPGTGLATNYTLVGGTDTVAVSRLGITVTGTASNKVYNANTSAVVILASNGVIAGDTVTFGKTSATFANKNVGTAKTVTISGITAGSTDGGNYTVNSSTTTTANITAAIVNLLGTRVYDANTDANASIFGASGTVNTGVGGEKLILSGSGTLVGKSAGAESFSSLNTLTLNNGTGLAGNYTLSGGTDTVTVTKLGITVAGTANDKVYDRGTAATLSTLGSGGVFAGDTVNFADTSATFADKNVGPAKTVTIAGITASGGDSGNYTLNNTGATTTANITPLGITVTGTANDKVYNANTTATGVSLASSGVITGDTVTFADTAATFGDKNVGPAKTVTISGITAGSTDGGNYTVNPSTTTTANITPLGITVTGTAGDKVYNANTTATGVSLASGGVLAGDTVTFADTAATFIDKNVGPAKTVTISGITAGSTDGGNYTVNPSTTTTANITAAIVNLSGTRVYDANTDANASIFGAGGTVNTGVGGENLVLSGSGTLVGKNAGPESSALNTLTLNDGTGLAGNYTLSGGTDTVNVTKLGITVAGTANNKVYDHGTAATLSTLGSSGVLAGDTVNFADTAATFADKNVGPAKTVAIAGITASGGDSGNYTLNNTGATTTANITPLGITVSGTGTNKIYDGGVNDAVTLASTGVLSGDTVMFGNTSARFADKNVGVGKAVAISGITASGLDAGNYSVNPTATTAANITPATLTETARPVTVPLGVTTPVLSGALSGFVPGDTVGNATSGTLAWVANAPAHPAVGSYAVTGIGLRAQNYIFAQAPANSAALSITTEPVPQGSATERVYGLVGLPISPDTVATPYGVGTNSERSNNTGNAKRDPDPASSNRRLTDFTDRTGLTVVGAGVRLPAEDAT